MIWWIIWYLLMGIIGSDFLAGFIIGIKTLVRDHYYEYDTIIQYTTDLGEKRRDASVLGRLANKHDIMTVVWIAFAIMTWPVEFLRQVFLDHPNAIELYETQHFKEEQA